MMQCSFFVNLRYFGRLGCNGSEITVEECQLMYVEVANCSEGETVVECVECEQHPSIHTYLTPCLCTVCFRKS